MLKLKCRTSVVRMYLHRVYFCVCVQHEGRQRRISGRRRRELSEPQSDATLGGACHVRAISLDPTPRIAS